MIVRNVMVQWREMDGETDEIQKLNSLFTSAFIGNNDIPADECLAHAKVVFDFWLAGAPVWEFQAKEYLNSVFAVGTNSDGTVEPLMEMIPVVTDTVARAKKLLRSGRWPDRLVAV